VFPNRLARRAGVIKLGLVAGRDGISGELKILIPVDDHRRFKAEAKEAASRKEVPVVGFGGEAFSEVNIVVDQVHIQHALVADEGPSKNAREFISSERKRLLPVRVRLPTLPSKGVSRTFLREEMT
jgi:hypothetical protein